MNRFEAVEEYEKAQKEAKKEYKECLLKARLPHPAVLEEMIGEDAAGISTAVGVVDIPVHRIVGTKAAGRISAFTPTFRPLLDADSEFAAKWISLCADQLGDEGIRDPIVCYEYLGYFYVQEGNKRVSVLRHLGATKIRAQVRRVMPVGEESARMKAYEEFLDFYKLTGLYDVLFTTPGSYAKLIATVGFSAQEAWSEEERRYFRARYSYFIEALRAAGAGKELPAAEDALLLWLQLHTFAELGELSASELKKTMTQMWPNLATAGGAEALVKTEPPEKKNKIVQMLKGKDHVNVAFVHLYNADNSAWTMAHEKGRMELEWALGKAVTTQVFFDANTPEQGETAIDEAVAAGADVVFTTAPQLIGPCLKGSVKYPKVRFLNCSLNQPYASVKTYYSRLYEAKYIAGAVAGAMSRDGRIGYVGDYPIWGAAAAINAFALGALLTNPEARIELKWSCLPGNPTEELLAKGIRVISKREREFGTYYADEEGELQPLGEPLWAWGAFYEQVVRSILDGNWEEVKVGQAVSHWWGMRNGVIDVNLPPELPEGVRTLALLLKKEICDGVLDPFARKIRDQAGVLRNDGTKTFSPKELMGMDWLCANVEGIFPSYEEVLPMAKPMMELLGIRPTAERGIHS